LNKNIKSIIQVALSNLSTIISGILVGFILPKIMKIESYGLYKTFTLYASYVGLFSLGIIDGIVLKYGEKNYEEFDKYKLRSIFRWYLIIHFLIALIICLISIYTEGLENKFLLICIAIYLVSNNITGYFQQISQITMRFKELSLRKILQSILNVIIILILFIYYKFGYTINYHYYLIPWILVNVILTIWYVYTYREIVFSKHIPLKNTFGEIIILMKCGFPLLFSNLCSSLILTLDRQFVNILFDTKTYALYAFAYNMLSFVTIATSAIATVLYPILKRTNNKNLKDNYNILIIIILMFVFGVMVIYFPLTIIIKYYLPQYTDSIIIFAIIFPGLAISSPITVIMHNYYKVFGDNLLFFKKSVIVLVISAIANYISYVLYKSTISISIASIVTIMIWYIYVEQYFVKKCGYKRNKNCLFITLLTIVFYFCSYYTNYIIGGILYSILFIIVSVAFYGNKFKNIKSIILSKK